VQEKRVTGCGGKQEPGRGSGEDGGEKRSEGLKGKKREEPFVE
jgi:hypothetical protein